MSMIKSVNKVISTYENIFSVSDDGCMKEDNTKTTKLAAGELGNKLKSKTVLFLEKYDFKMPIEYCESRCLSKIVRDDLEMSCDMSNNNIVSNILSSSNEPCSKYNLLLNKWSSIYSLDKKFIKDNQKVLKKYKKYSSNMDAFVEDYVNYKQQQNFLSKFQYIQFTRFSFLNKLPDFLQFLALYNFCTPFMALLAPLIGLIMPYFVLYFKGIRLTFDQYSELIRKIILNQRMIKGLLNFSKNSLQSNMYVLTSIFFYVMSLYNNILSCIDFYKNVEFMICFIDKYEKFITNGELLIDNIHKYTQNRKSFCKFNDKMMEQKAYIRKMKHQICEISNCSSKYIKYGKIGKMLKCNYDLFNIDRYDETIGYLIYLNNYNNDLSNISNLVKNGKMNMCKFVGNCDEKPFIKGNYYLHLLNEKSICNDVSTKTNCLITGPNASGKTTLIKSTLINLFLSQSIGCGCYKKCKTQIYDYYHSYLNIPDTSSRDSLFQAEARRCKEIMTFIEKHKKKKHFCVFDEIYSGTNPNDAVLCASVYLENLNKYKDNVDYLLTTHYIDICKKFQKSTNVSNKKMKVVVDENGKIHYKYKIVNGISDINGGYQILKQLD